MTPNLYCKLTDELTIDVLCAQLTRDLFAIAKFLVAKRSEFVDSCAQITPLNSPLVSILQWGAGQG